MKHTVKEVVLKNGARGLFINIPDATVMQYSFSGGQSLGSFAGSLWNGTRYGAYVVWG